MTKRIISFFIVATLTTYFSVLAYTALLLTFSTLKSKWDNHKEKKNNTLYKNLLIGRDKHSVLISEAILNKTNIVKECILDGANIDYQDKHGATALICASYSGSTETVKFLLSKGANIDYRDDMGETALT